MNKRSFRSSAKVSRLLRAGAGKRNILVQDRDILRRKRSELAEAAFDLFLDRGFHRTGVREIAAAAGLSVGAVFTYFTDKEEILAHIFFEQLERLEKELLGTLRTLIGEGTRAGADPETVFDTVFAQFLRAVDTLHRFIILAYQESKSLNPIARKELMLRERRVQELLGDAIRYGAQRGRFAADDIDLKAHNIVVLGHAWAIRHWMLAGVMDSVEQYGRLLRPLIYSMLETGVKARLPKTVGSRARGEERRKAATNREKAYKPTHVQNQAESEVNASRLLEARR